VRPAALHLRIGSRRNKRRRTAGAATHQTISSVSGGPAVRWSLSGQRQYVSVVVGQALADAHRRPGPVALTDSDDHRRAQGQTQELALRRCQHHPGRRQDFDSCRNERVSDAPAVDLLNEPIALQDSPLRRAGPLGKRPDSSKAGRQNEFGREGGVERIGAATH
jgi:hypothetical protein